VLRRPSPLVCKSLDIAEFPAPANTPILELQDKERVSRTGLIYLATSSDRTPMGRKMKSKLAPVHAQ
jgi:hypothetical protein